MPKSDRPAGLARPVSSRGRCLPCDPFEGYFLDRAAPFIPEGGILDGENARAWLETVGWGSRSGLYTYQQALQSKSGPRVRVGGQELLMLSSYDYLGLIGHPAVESAAIEAIRRFGTGTGGVRLLAGTTELHRRFEAQLAAFKGAEAAVTFSSGYAANIAAVTALLGPGDRAIVDARVHRSTMDACRLAGVPVRPFRHNDLRSLRHGLASGPRGRRTLVIVEGIYSMDGDICPLPDVIELKNRYGAHLMVDEAHSFGVLGPGGRGVNEHFGLDAGGVDIWMGCLSKAIPANGGFIAGSRELIIALQHGSAPFMFSAALCPAAVAAAGESLDVIRREPDRLSRVRRNADMLRSRLREMGCDTGRSESPVIPLIVGRDETAYRMARKLFGAGILATAVVYPAVPRGSARLRLCATAAQDDAFLGDVEEGFRSVLGRARPARISRSVEE